MKLLLLLVAMAIGAQAGSRNGTRPPREAAMMVHGLGYYNGKYYKLAGGIAASKSQGKVAACFKIKGSDGSKVYQFVHFDFKNNASYFASGPSKDEMKCQRIPMSHAKSLKCLCPRSWPNHRVVANTTLTGARVPISVHCGRFSKGDVSVKIGGLFDNRGVPVLIKKKYKKAGKSCGGALVFHGLKRPRSKYFSVPEICRSAAKSKRSSARKCPSGPTGCPRPM